MSKKSSNFAPDLKKGNMNKGLYLILLLVLCRVVTYDVSGRFVSQRIIWVDENKVENNSIRKYVKDCVAYIDYYQYIK